MKEINLLEATAQYEMFKNEVIDLLGEALRRAPAEDRPEVFKYYNAVLHDADLRFYLGTLR